MSARAYAKLRTLGDRVTTGEAAAALGVSTSSASHTLRTLETRGLARQVRRGLWIMERTWPDARRLAADLTRPYPSYVSFESALFAHDAIDQVPRAIALASLGRPRVIRTAVATFIVHRLPPELFGGFETTGDLRMASVEKAIFDFCYVAEASGRRRRRLPELELSARFSHREIDRWPGKIGDPRLQRRVRARIEDALSAATTSA